MKDSLSIRAAIIAAAIRACNGKRITQDAANAALRAALPQVPAECMGDVAMLFINLSALNQDLERFGLVQTERAKPALIAAVEAELEGR